MVEVCKGKSGVTILEEQVDKKISAKAQSCLCFGFIFLSVLFVVVFTSMLKTLLSMLRWEAWGI